MKCLRLGAATAAAFIATTAHALPERISPSAAEATQRLAANTGGAIVDRSRRGSAYRALRATGARPLMADDTAEGPLERAGFFLSVYGAALGMTDPARELAPQRVSTDAAGNRHVHFDQLHHGLPVFGSRVVVHLGPEGVRGVNAVYVPGVDKVATTPTRTLGTVRAAALAYAAKHHGRRPLRVDSGRWVIFPVGLLQGRPAAPRLAYEAIVSGATGNDVRERIFVDGHTGRLLERIDEIHSVLNREIYTPDQTVAPAYDEQASTVLIPAGPAMASLIDDPGHNAATTSDPAPGLPTDNLYVFAGGTYALYDNMFGRKGYDACDVAGPCQPDIAGPAWTPVREDVVVGQIQKSVYLVNQNCPNAYWNGDSTNYCPGFDADDIVSHEWSHAYTQYTHDLIYAYQSGALNESYSDIFGETYDLVNNIEGPLGSLTLTEHQYYEDGGNRWVVGEDLSEEAAALLLRDMWKPDDFPATTPGKATSGNYTCGSGDGGGVHTNSSVPNHAFAMLVDGTAGQGPVGSTGLERDSYNHQSFAGIGLVKAAHIYFHAMTNYQGPSTDFPQHADALRASCADLIGVNLKGTTGALSGQMIAAADCEVVNQAMLATEMDLGAPCPFQPVLEQNAPAICPGASTIFGEDWESGDDGWSKTSVGQFAEWEDDSRPLRDFVLNSGLPANRAGTAAFARNIPVGEPGGGTCQSGGDYSGLFTYDGPEFTIPADAVDLHVRFDHYVATEATADGGQLEVSVNGGAFAAVPQENFAFNAPNSALLGPLDLSNNPRGGQEAWNGTDINAPSGAPPSSWGTTIVDLAGLALPGNTVRLRFTFAQEGCNGVDGWYIDDVRVYSCPILEPPVLALGDDYDDPDPDGVFTLTWTRPTGAAGPDLVQQSATSCAPAFSDDASAPLAGGANALWSGSGQWTSAANPTDASQAYYIADGALQDEALTLIDPVTIPAAGATALTFTTTYGLELNYDYGHVEISADGGTTWSELAALNGPAGLGATPADVIEGAQSLDVTAYAAQSVLFRFRMTSDNYNEGAPAGWFVDNIAVVNDNWGDLLTTAATQHTIGADAGASCYRVRSAYSIDDVTIDSPYSNVVLVNVLTVAGIPIADAGANLVVLEGDAAQLSGAGSSDPDGGALTYAWTQLTGPAAALTGADTAMPSFTAPDVAVDTPALFQLRVTDAQGLQDVDEVLVSVRAKAAGVGNNRLFGGALPGATLLLLALAGLGRRRIRG